MLKKPVPAKEESRKITFTAKFNESDFSFDKWLFSEDEVTVLVVIARDFTKARWLFGEAIQKGISHKDWVFYRSDFKGNQLSQYYGGTCVVVEELNFLLEMSHTDKATLYRDLSGLVITKTIQIEVPSWI